MLILRTAKLLLNCLVGPFCQLKNFRTSWEWASSWPGNASVCPGRVSLPWLSVLLQSLLLSSRKRVEWRFCLFTLKSTRVNPLGTVGAKCPGLLAVHNMRPGCTYVQLWSVGF